MFFCNLVMILLQSVIYVTPQHDMWRILSTEYDLKTKSKRIHTEMWDMLFTSCGWFEFYLFNLDCRSPTRGHTSLTTLSYSSNEDGYCTVTGCALIDFD